MTIIQVCKGRTCASRHSKYITTRLLSDKAKWDENDEVVIEECLCQGNCDYGPTVIMDGTKHSHMNPAKASELLMQKIRNAKKILNK